MTAVSGNADVIEFTVECRFCPTERTSTVFLQCGPTDEDPFFTSERAPKALMAAHRVRQEAGRQLADFGMVPQEQMTTILQ
jgi:hypothetical protein